MSARLIRAFLAMLSAERGAAANTISSYEHDLEDYLAALSAKNPARSRRMLRICAATCRTSRKRG